MTPDMISVTIANQTQRIDHLPGVILESNGNQIVLRKHLDTYTSTLKTPIKGQPSLRICHGHCSRTFNLSRHMPLKVVVNHTHDKASSRHAIMSHIHANATRNDKQSSRFSVSFDDSAIDYRSEVRDAGTSNWWTNCQDDINIVNLLQRKKDHTEKDNLFGGFSRKHPGVATQPFRFDLEMQPESKRTGRISSGLFVRESARFETPFPKAPYTRYGKEPSDFDCRVETSASRRPNFKDDIYRTPYKEIHHDIEDFDPLSIYRAQPSKSNLARHQMAIIFTSASTSVDKSYTSLRSDVHPRINSQRQRGDIEVHVDKTAAYIDRHTLMSISNSVVADRLVFRGLDVDAGRLVVLYCRGELTESGLVDSVSHGRLPDKAGVEVGVSREIAKRLSVLARDYPLLLAKIAYNAPPGSEFGLLDLLLSCKTTEPSDICSELWKMICNKCEKKLAIQIKHLVDFDKISDRNFLENFSKLSGSGQLIILEDLCKPRRTEGNARLQILISRALRYHSVQLLFAFPDQDAEAINYLSYNHSYLDSMTQACSYAISDIQPFIRYSTLTFNTRSKPQTPLKQVNSASYKFNFSTIPHTRYYISQTFSGCIRLLVDICDEMIRLSILDVPVDRGYLIGVCVGGSDARSVKWIGVRNLAPVMVVSRDELKENRAWPPQDLQIKIDISECHSIVKVVEYVAENFDEILENSKESQAQEQWKPSIDFNPIQLKSPMRFKNTPNYTSKQLSAAEKLTPKSMYFTPSIPNQQTPESLFSNPLNRGFNLDSEKYSNLSQMPQSVITQPQSLYYVRPSLLHLILLSPHLRSQDELRLILEFADNRYIDKLPTFVKIASLFDSEMISHRFDCSEWRFFVDRCKSLMKIDDSDKIWIYEFVDRNCARNMNIQQKTNAIGRFVDYQMKDQDRRDHITEKSDFSIDKWSKSRSRMHQNNIDDDFSLSRMAHVAGNPIRQRQNTFRNGQYFNSTRQDFPKSADTSTFSIFSSLTDYFARSRKQPEPQHTPRLYKSDPILDKVTHNALKALDACTLI